MKIEYENDIVKITDLLLSAAILAEHPDVELKNTAPVPNKEGQMFFVLSGNVSEIKKMVSRYFSGTLSVSNVMEMGEVMKKLKFLIHSGRNNG